MIESSSNDISHSILGYPARYILVRDVPKEERRVSGGRGLKITIKNYEAQLAFASNPARDTVTEHCNYRA